MQKRTKIILSLGFYGLLFSVLFGVNACGEDSEAFYEKVAYRNLAPDTEYVGIETCKQCHNDIHTTYVHTGMGQSFAKAHQSNSKAEFDNISPIYEAESNFYYWPFIVDSLMYVKEFRLDEYGDTIHQRTEQLKYIIGSGQHTNSHIININGYIYQAPITYYTQDEKWDMAPSYRAEGNLRFSRLLNSECITCHNNFPKMVSGSENKIVQMPEGIQCERCHGPGGLHVAEKKAGIIVNVENDIDNSIVNPAKLSRDLQMDLCQRCHLQGTAVLEPGKTFYDFKPGMKLSEVVNVFLPRYSDSDKRFIMASQADRLRQSECFINTDMTCVTCHDPHISVKQMDGNHFVNACLKCHQEDAAKHCTVSDKKRDAANNNCSNCHMPKSKSLDIAHVRITDHKIQKYANWERTDGRQSFYGLQILTKDKASSSEMARGYLAQYDKYTTQSYILDSVEYYLEQMKADEPVFYETKIHFLFNKKDYDAIAKIADGKGNWVLNDAWTAYRIAESYRILSQGVEAFTFIEKAIKLLPFNLDFLEKKAVILMDLKRNKEARIQLDFVLKENPKRPVALCNRGLLFVVQGNLLQGELFYDKAIALNPDYEQALLNKAAVRNLKNDKTSAIALIQRVLKLNPMNLEAKKALEFVRAN